jgi:hypothetical protein
VLADISRVCHTQRKSQNISHINKIEGFGASDTKKLEAEGIKTAEHSLQAGSSPKHRQELAKKDRVL